MNFNISPSRKIPSMIIIMLGIAIISYNSVAQSSINSQQLQKLRTVQNRDTGSIAIYRGKGKEPILTVVAKMDQRPYIHPVIAPDGKGVLTEYRPSHHIHQTGIYWGLKLVNGRDFFQKWQSDYWRGVSASVLQSKGKQIKWQTVYDMLDEKGNTIMVETQTWTMRDYGGKYVLDLEWKGTAKMDVTMGKFYVGGLFIRMPWVRGTVGELTNALGQHNMELEAQRAIWGDVGVKLDGREDYAHFAIFDHPDNKAFPTPWRVDSQLGLGPSRQILGDWKLATGETEVARYRLVVYTGVLNSADMTREFKQFVREY